jgi:hypothetical protein
MRDVGERQCRPTEKTLLIRIISPLEQSSHFEVGWSGGDPTRTLHMSLMRKKEEIPNQMLTKRKKKNITRRRRFGFGPTYSKTTRMSSASSYSKSFWVSFLVGV